MLTSILRTLIPALWGSLIGWFLTVVPVLEPLRADLLAYGELAVPVIAALLIGGWYAVCRWLEPHMPDWLTRILLGSAKSPVYEPTVRVGTSPERVAEIETTMNEARRQQEARSCPIPEPHEPTEADRERYEN